MKTRREFLKATSLVSLTPVLPSVFGQTARAARRDSSPKTLVVIQLDGGNDGINTVVPFGDDAYGRVRRKLHQQTKELHRLNDHVGLHQSMKPAFELFEDGNLAIVQGVGYPNPNRSHFRSMKIWHTAKLDDADHTGSGWLGSALDRQLMDASAVATSEANAIYVGKEQVPPALWGRRSSAIGLSNVDDLQLDSPLVANSGTAPTDTRDIARFVHQQMVSAHDIAQSFAAIDRNVQTDVSYPDSELAEQLKLVSKLLRSGSSASVFYTIQPGYDTHSQQSFTHLRLLSQLSGAMKAFLDDIKASGLDDRVVVLAFSEFGRRVEENVSAGTDHGSCGPVFLAGTPVRGGLVGETPDLTDLVDGDLKTGIDFRQIYATILSQWMRISPEEVIGSGHPPLNLFS